LSRLQPIVATWYDDTFRRIARLPFLLDLGADASAKRDFGIPPQLPQFMGGLCALFVQIFDERGDPEDQSGHDQDSEKAHAPHAVAQRPE
jgi:hypothetical protein